MSKPGGADQLADVVLRYGPLCIILGVAAAIAMVVWGVNALCGGVP